ncbi:histidine kinase [Aureisphaera galaxeae]|uniref:sensor histidine kinase n=1 Tax=Aureisphaera galaxeae TaxID=1538023 RepID=UPI002350ED10|nr:ATP-binding protein [Aureisphaera galaxeae]MDC8004273.1 histidine kinase [Aureisphaera galaxeae]
MNNENNTDFIIAIIAGSLLLFVLSTFIVAFTTLYFKRRREYKRERELLQSEFKSTLFKSQLEIKEQTMQFLSEELHDNIGQIASVIKIYLSTLNLDKKEEAEDKIEESSKLIKQLLKDLKLLSLSLNSQHVTQYGLLEGLKLEAERLNKIDNFEANLQVSGKQLNLDPDKATILYRMSQEIINNTLKHSNAKVLQMNISIQEKFLTLVFNDDGIGFNLREKLDETGSGLKNLHHRAELIGANLQIITSPKQQGTAVIITLQL